MPYSDYIRIIRNTFGKVATVSSVIPDNQLVRIMKGVKLEYPSQTSIRVGHRKHIEDNVGRWVNHSCCPTLRVIGPNHLWSTREILPGMPLTFNYMKNENVISTPFVCIDCSEIVPRPGGCDKYK
jgi:hypothetical protein